MDMKLFSIDDDQKVVNIPPLEISSRINKLVSQEGRVCVLVFGQIAGQVKCTLQHKGRVTELESGANSVITTLSLL